MIERLFTCERGHPLFSVIEGQALKIKGHKGTTICIGRDLSVAAECNCGSKLAGLWLEDYLPIDTHRLRIVALS